MNASSAHYPLTEGSTSSKTVALNSATATAAWKGVNTVTPASQTPTPIKASASLSAAARAGIGVGAALAGVAIITVLSILLAMRSNQRRKRRVRIRGEIRKPAQRAYMREQMNDCAKGFSRKGTVRVYQGPPIELASDSMPGLHEMESPKAQQPKL